MNWIELAQDKNLKLSLVNKVMCFGFQKSQEVS